MLPGGTSARPRVGFGHRVPSLRLPKNKKAIFSHHEKKKKGRDLPEKNMSEVTFSDFAKLGNKRGLTPQ